MTVQFTKGILQTASLRFVTWIVSFSVLVVYFQRDSIQAAKHFCDTFRQEIWTNKKPIDPLLAASNKTSSFRNANQRNVLIFHHYRQIENSRSKRMVSDLNEDLQPAVQLKAAFLFFLLCFTSIYDVMRNGFLLVFVDEIRIAYTFPLKPQTARLITHHWIPRQTTG